MGVLVGQIQRLHSQSRHVQCLRFGAELADLWTFGTSLLASNSSVEAPLQPAKLFECINQGGCDVGSRFAVQTLSLD
jgi:hypothetical protein